MSTQPHPPQTHAAAAAGDAASDLAHLLDLGFELAATPTALLDGTGHYIRVNAAFASLFGNPASSFVGTSFVDLTHPDDRARDVGFIERLGNSESQQSSVQKRYVRGDGSIIFARTAVSVIHREAGRPSVLLAEIMDHSELHGALEALRASEERLTFAMLATNDGLWDWDLASGALVVNDNWFSMLGYGPGELAPHIKTWEYLSHPEDVPVAYAQLEAHMKGELPQVDFEMRMRRKDGGWLWIRNRAKVVSFNEDGSPRRVVGLHTDISARRQQAQALRDQATLLDSVLSNIPIAIDIISTTGKIDYLNAYAVQLMGWSLEEARNMDLLAAVFPDEEYRARAIASIASASPAWQDWDIRTRDGRLLTMSWSNVPLPDGRVIGIGNDVTATRAAENAEERAAAQIQQAQKLESLGLLAGGIAHDFNNLLVGVLGNASMAEELLTPGSDAAHLVAEVRAAATRAAELTRQLLAYAGKGRFVVEPVDVSVLAAEMAALLRAATSKQATLKQDLTSGLPAVEADATQLRQVVMNLITNASDSLGDAPGTITLRTSLKMPSESERGAVVGGTPLPPGRYVCIEVSDNGSGMSAETLARVFDPFFTTKESGHGLGLAATLGIVRSHRGGITLHSVEGSGTTFYVYLPAIERGPRLTPAPKTGVAQVLHGEGHILLADDEPAVRQVAARSLQRAGFEITQCQDGAEALRVFEAEPLRWRAVVLDLTMPNLGGQEALIRMRRIRADVPAILCSGYASQELSAAILAMPSVMFVEKPFSSTRLVSAVLDVIHED